MRPGTYLLISAAEHYGRRTGRSLNLDHAMAWHVRSAPGEALWRSEAGLPVRLALAGGGTPADYVSPTFHGEAPGPDGLPPEGGLRPVVGQGRRVPDLAEGPRAGDPRIHPRPRWPPDRGRSDDGQAGPGLAAGEAAAKGSGRLHRRLPSRPRKDGAAPRPRRASWLRTGCPGVPAAAPGRTGRTPPGCAGGTRRLARCAFGPGVRAAHRPPSCRDRAGLESPEQADGRLA